ncbi:uncharacterized protein LOC141586921 [Silene latifolia]|uniref:uncharacterized protein LOC141586921 n=1 Tax=Silene latifolia TaxID=37657 RepID=UPI003D786FEA
MGKKRKSIASSLDEVDRTMYTTFCSAASSLSQLYTQAMNHQKLSFQAGERHGLEKLYQWMLRQQEEGARVATVDILTYLQRELDCLGDEPSMSPRAPVQNHSPQTPTHFTSSGLLVSGSSAQTPATQLPRTEQENQAKNSVFSNALLSPVRQNLQHYHLAQGGYHPNGSTPTSHQNRESNSNDSSSMDMHQDSPGPESNY